MLWSAWWFPAVNIHPVLILSPRCPSPFDVPLPAPPAVLSLPRWCASPWFAWHKNNLCCVQDMWISHVVGKTSSYSIVRGTKHRKPCVFEVRHPKKLPSSVGTHWTTCQVQVPPRALSSCAVGRQLDFSAPAEWVAEKMVLSARWTCKT